MHALRGGGGGWRARGPAPAPGSESAPASHSYRVNDTELRTGREGVVQVLRACPRSVPVVFHVLRHEEAADI